MQKTLKHILVFICLIGVLILPYFVFAKPSDKMTAVAGVGGYETTDDDSLLYTVILGKVISTFLSILGVIFIFLIVLAGYNWMTASGKEEKVNRAISDIRRAIVGLVIIVGSYAIWNFIYTRFLGGS